MPLKTKLLIYLLSLAIIDLLIPFPIVACVLMYVVLQKPEWFQVVVKQLYDTRR